jgi:hypothetical protein
MSQISFYLFNNLTSTVTEDMNVALSKVFDRKQAHWNYTRMAPRKKQECVRNSLTVIFTHPSPLQMPLIEIKMIPF